MAELPQYIDNNVLDNVDTIFVIGNIFIKQNGIVKSVLGKVKSIEDVWGYKPFVLVADYNIELVHLNLLLQNENYSGEQAQINKNSRIMGVYGYFQKTYSSTQIIVYKKGVNEEGLTYKEDPKNVFSVYEGEKLVRQELYTGLNSRLRLIRRYDERGKVSREIFYDDCGCISMIRNFDPENENYYPTQNFYTTDKKLCIKAEYRFNKKAIKKSEQNELVKLTVFDDNGNIEKVCADNAELAAYCVHKLVKGKKKVFMVVGDEGTYHKVPILADSPNVAKACVVHSAFQNNPYQPNSGPQMYYKYMCENFAKFDGIVMLTKAEHKDFIKQYADIKNIFVIPHPYPNPIVLSDFDDRDPKKGVIVGRFSSEKRINYAIDIFKMVVTAVPDAKLEIYGFGSEEKNYVNQIKRLGLEKNVFIKGFTKDAPAVFRSAAFSMSTSTVEGYGLVLSESICNGCPAFSFDIKYGPSDIIIDGKTGYLTKREDKRGYADKIIKYLKDEELQREMSKNAYDDAPRFSKEMFLERWYSFTKAMYELKNTNI